MLKSIKAAFLVRDTSRMMRCHLCVLSNHNTHHHVNSLRQQKYLKCQSIMQTFPLQQQKMSSSSSDSMKKKSFFVNEKKDGWNVYNVLVESIAIFESHHVPEPEHSACHLLSSILYEWEDNGFRILMESLQNRNNGMNSMLLSEEQVGLYEDMVHRRISMEPIQYILGKWDFLDFTLNIKSPCLCPRPETEELVQLVIDHISTLQQQQQQQQSVRVLDVGCGTGAIGIALAKYFGSTKIQVVAVDISNVAVEVTQQNAQQILSSSTENDYFKVIKSSAKEYIPEEQKFDVIVSNPPYIPKDHMKTLSKDVLNHEDYYALCGGIDGMDVIRDIITNLPNWTSSGCSCWMEVDPSHPSLLQEYLCSQESVEYVDTYKDLSGFDRFVQLRVANKK